MDEWCGEWGGQGVVATVPGALKTGHRYFLYSAPFESSPVISFVSQTKNWIAEETSEWRPLLFSFLSCLSVSSEHYKMVMTINCQLLNCSASHNRMIGTWLRSFLVAEKHLRKKQCFTIIRALRRELSQQLINPFKRGTSLWIYYYFAQEINVSFDPEWRRRVSCNWGAEELDVQ